MHLTRRIAVAVLALVALAACRRRPTEPAGTMPTGRFAGVVGGSVVAFDFDGSNRREYAGVTPVAQYGLRPVWTPGGQRIIVHSGTESGARLHTIDAATGTVRPLIAAPTGLAHEWYPDAATPGWVYFSGEITSGELLTWRVRPDGTNPQQVAPTTPAYPQYYRPALSPDGAKLAVSVVVDGVASVRVFDAASGNALSPVVQNATAPRWSPDGRLLAFSSVRGGPIRVMRPNGSDLRQIGAGRYGEWFDWTADGQWLLAENRQVGALDLVRVSNGVVMPLPFTAGMWQPTVRR